MDKKIGISFFLLLFFTVLAFGDKKARVITESGKKWDVVFLRMSNDTIYLKARKTNGAFFHISGYKSKFKKVEFSDGSVLDLGLSNFPSAENQSKPQNLGEWSANDSLYHNPAYGGASLTDAGFNSAVSPLPDSSAASAASRLAYEPKPDTLAFAAKTADTVVSSKSLENTRQTSGPKGEAAAQAILFVETKPSKASIEIDDRPVEGVSPLTIHNLTEGKHKVRAYMDSLEASKKVTLVSWKTKQVKLELVSRKKGHTVAFSLYALSAAALAGSGISYFFYMDHHKKAEDAYSLYNQQASVNGKAAKALLQTYRDEHDDAQQQMKVSQILLGGGAACLGAGIVFYF